MAKTIAIDFDGVIHRYNGWNNGQLNEPIPHAKDAINTFLADGFDVVIYTTRTATVVKEWLEKWEFPPLPISNEKPLAIVLVDDRAFRFDGYWTPNVVKSIEHFKTYWEQVKDAG